MATNQTTNTDYNDWFEREFGMPGTTQQERENVATYGPEMVYGQSSSPAAYPAASPVPSAAVSQQPHPATEGYQNLLAAKATSYAGYIALVDRLRALDFAYYQQASPIVTDQEYEALKYQCILIEELHPDWKLADSPTLTIGDDTLTGLPRVGHRTPMLSLQKCGGTTDDARRNSLQRWYDRTAQCKQLAVEWKYDGNSVSLVYQDGQLVEASTRGQDGTSGSLITAQLLGLPTIPTTIDANGRVEIRGELFIPDARYQALWDYERAKTQQAQVRKVLEQYRQPQLARQQGFEFRVFEVIMPNGSTSHTERMQWAFSQGFTPVTITNVSSFDELLPVIAAMEDQRSTLGLPTDGIVIKLDDDRDRECFGATAHHPHWAIAWKYAATRITVTITSVGTTRTGKPCLFFDQQTINGHDFDHVDVKAAAYQQHPFTVGEQIIIALKPGSSSIQFEAPATTTTTPSATPKEEIHTAPRPVSSCYAAAITAPSQPSSPVPSTDYLCFPRYYNEAAAYDLWLQAHAPVPVPRPVSSCYAAAPASAPTSPVPSAPMPSQPSSPASKFSLLRGLGFLAAASIALVASWHTGLLIPLGLLGIASSLAK